MFTKIFFMVVCACLLLSCSGEKADTENIFVYPLETDLKPVVSDTLTFQLNRTDSLGVVAIGVKKSLSIKRRKVPTTKSINAINSLLAKDAKPDTSNGNIVFTAGTTDIPFSYNGESGGYYIFHSNKVILVFNATTDERYAIVFVPDALNSPSVIQAVFYLDAKLMPVFAIKSDRKAKRPGVGYEGYTYTGNDFTVLKYGRDKNPKSVVGAVVLSNLKEKKAKAQSELEETAIAMPALNKYTDSPLWNNAEGYYLF